MEILHGKLKKGEIMIEPPKRLSDSRFILVNKKEKLPIEKEWPKRNNYDFSSEILKKHILNGGNYGVLTGDGLIVIDADTEELNEIVKREFPKTFCVKTRNGHHYYFHCMMPKKVLSNGNVHLGEIQSKGQFVIGPGSIHPSGITYEIEEDVEIAKIDPGLVKEKLGKFFKAQNRITKEVLLNGPKEGMRNDSLFKLACMYRDNDLTIDEAKILLAGVNEKANQPLPLFEIDRILQSAFSYEKQKSKIDFSTLNEEEIQLKEEVYKININPDSSPEKKMARISEIITKYLLKKYHIYTLRSDEKREMWIYKQGIYVPNGESYVKEFCRLILTSIYKIAYTNIVLNKIEADTFIEASDFFQNDHPNLIALENGLFDLKEGRLIDFDSSKILFNKIPIKYQEDLRINKIRGFIEDIIPLGDIDIIQEVFGFCLLKEYKYSVAFMFLGSGSNGKSRLCELLTDFLGPENVSAVQLSELNEGGFAVANLHNKMANIATDISATTLEDSSIFKKLVGGDWLSADRKFKERVQFKNYAKVINALNELPKTKDITDGFFRRWKTIKFPYKFVSEYEYENYDGDKSLVKKANPQILNSIKNDEEMSGLFNWAYEGLRRIFKNKGFSDNQTTNEKRVEWLRISSSIRAFMMDCIESADIENYILKKDFLSVYTNYCKKHNVKIEGSKSIRYALEEMGVFDGQINDETRSRVWYKIKFNGKIGENSCTGCTGKQGVSSHIEDPPLLEQPGTLVLPVQGVQKASKIHINQASMNKSSSNLSEIGEIEEMDFES